MRKLTILIEEDEYVSVTKVNDKSHTADLIIKLLFDQMCSAVRDGTDLYGMTAEEMWEIMSDTKENLSATTVRSTLTRMSKEGVVRAYEKYTYTSIVWMLNMSVKEVSDEMSLDELKAMHPEWFADDVSDETA